jgi:hypothetical protein
VTEEGERALLTDYLATCGRLQAGFVQTVALVKPLMPMTAARIDQLTFEHDSYILGYLKRYEQFEDALHRTLKAISKIMEHGKIERLTSVDVTRRAYALGILPSEKIWADAVRTRNALAHEYPLNPHKRADQVNAAWDSRETLIETWAAIERFVEQERLLA